MRWLISFLLTIILSGWWPMNTAKAQSSGKHDHRADVVYEVYVQSFCDSNQDGIGDLPGLISKLDYIQELGATAIWLMPIHPSPSYHKYDVTDYYGIHPDFGTMEDMDRFIAEATKRNLKIILDLVINHTSAEHPWFKASASSKDNPYRQYYVWKDYEAVKNELEKKSTTFDSDNLTQWHEWDGQDERYYGFFWKGMPDLNFDYPPVRDEVYKIGKFWLDKGIDGFRLDAAKHIYPDDQIDDTRKFWEEFTSKMRAIDRDVIIVGEVWDEPALLASLFKGLPSLFNFELTKAIPECILAADADKFRKPYANVHAAYTKVKTPYDDAILLSNHDMNRIRSTLNQDIEKSKLAASILLTLPGTTYIYYGEEIGMLGVKPDIHLREPFLWGDATFSDTSWQQPVYSISPDVASLQDQLEDQNSIYHYYKRWIQLRRDHPDLACGEVQFQNLEDNHLLAFIIKGHEGTFWVIHNLGDQPKSLPLRDKAINLVTDSPLEPGGDFQLPPFSTSLLLMKK